MRHTFTSLAIAVAALVAAAAASATDWPAPDGEHAVGVVRAEFVDPSRPLDAADPASGPRRLPAIVWYPAQAADSGDAAAPAYLEGDAAATTLPAIARNFGYAEDDLRALTAVRVDARPGARPARHPRGFPVVVFSHGFFLYPQQNTALATRLASHGYIVVSIAHPGDAADVRLEDGRVAATRLGGEGDDPRLAEALKVLAGGADPQALREALPTYAEALPATRIGRSFAGWRDDTLAVAGALADGREPGPLRDVLAGADRGRLAFAGMSFGGATSATSCRLVDACRAAVNLDGQNFDPVLYDGPVERPLLLMLSDWTRYGLLEGQPRDADFSPNDLAYARWRDAGREGDVVRVRLQGARHMGFTDLVALLDGPKREERVGEIDGAAALSAIGDLVLAFLDAHVRDGDAADVDRAIERHPALVRHAPRRLEHWAGDADTAVP
ncbi:hypothetical protein LDO32_01780 [Luteimonas sp. Y-2-2-4F]|nr:hypothetical protein [Luteimonas sp. Y-2-2-4F]MCD9030464.1 hypothetical protein [Luteimonas sp. Y-2-2-4F]